jgi:hypothetical protein
MERGKRISVALVAGVGALGVAAWFFGRGGARPVEPSGEGADEKNAPRPAAAFSDGGRMKRRLDGIVERLNKPFFIDPETRKTRVEIPERLKGIVGLEPDAGYRRRMDALKSLMDAPAAGRLSDGEAEALLSFLHKAPETDPLPTLELDAVKNDAFRLLMAQNRDGLRLEEELLAMREDGTLGPVWREYCLQFIGQMYRDARPEDRDLMRRSLERALDGGDGESVGTALLWMGRLVDTGDFSEEDIRGKAYAVCVDPAVDDKVKITAFQVASKLRHPEIAALARKVIGAKRGSVPLKMSAIAVLGDNGGPEDVAALARLAKSPDRRLRIPAKTALGKLTGEAL